MKILVCITGASYCSIGLRLLQEVSKTQETFAIISENAKVVLEKENDIKFDKKTFKNVTFFDDFDLSASVASGSFKIDKTIVVPCSINTLAKISCGISDTLIARACAVCIKENKKLVLGVREMPFSSITLENMVKLAQNGVIIAPPIIASYSKASTIQEVENFIIGKWLDILDIENNLYRRWQ